MIPDISQMTSSVASTLAQIIPVLFLTLLFEVRARPVSDRRSKLGIVVGFLGNLSVAFGAISLEFGLLGITQSGDMQEGAQLIWGGCFALFAITLVRWMATTTATKILANTTSMLGATALQSIATNEAILSYVETVKKSPILFISEALIAPSQVFADVLVTAASTFVEVLHQTAAIISDMARHIAAVFGRRSR